MKFNPLLSILEKNRIRLELREDQVRLSAPEGALTEEIKSAVRQHSAELIEHLKRETPKETAGTIPRVKDRAEGYPLSWFQERLWILNQRNPDDVSYNVPVLFRVEGTLDVGALERSLSEIVRRHESLRTRFEMTQGGEAVQLISPAAAVELPLVEVEDEDIKAHVDAIVTHRFDLSNGPVIVARLLRRDAETHFLLINVHHIVSDAWSIVGIFMRELQVCYAAYCTDRSPQLPPLKIRYRDFSVWQRNLDVSQYLAYWKRELEGYEDTLELPSDFMRRPQSGEISETFTYHYPKAFSRALERFSKTHRVTLFISLLAGLGVTVNRYTGKSDLCIGTTAAGRNLVELEPLIGFLVNILPLRLRIDESMSVASYLETVRGIALAGFDHQMAPFEEILYSFDGAERGKKNALVPVIMRHQTFPHAEMDRRLPGDVRFTGFAGGGDGEGEGEGKSAASIPARCEIEMSYSGDGEALELEIVFASDLYTRGTIERLLAHHQQVLEQMFADDARPLSGLSLLSDEDVTRLCGMGRSTERSLTTGTTFVDRFEAQRGKTPDSVACYDDAGEWRFDQIAAQSSRLAHGLIAEGVRAGDLVGLCLNQGAPLLASLLGVWKAGAAYVPLDPSYPEAYLRQIIEDAAPVRVVTTSDLREKLGLPDALCFALDRRTETLKGFPKTPPDIRLDRGMPAYLMYTSGSTGVPKGVRVPHRQLMNWLEYLERRWPFEPGEVVAQKTTIAFAVSVKELFAGLLNGLPQVFLDSDTIQDMEAFVEALAKYQVSRLNLVPSHLKGVLGHLRQRGMSLPAMRFCTTAGEPLTPEVVRNFRTQLPHARLLNNYGCTELNDITYYDTAGYDGDQGFVPIGKPIQNTRLYVLDRAGRMVPEGVAGELHVETLGMSNGYHNMEAMTAERYLPNPFSDDPDRRLYNTGDVVKYLPDGNLEYIGRWDFQVKVRGFRVDVRQVEKVLGDFPGIGARAVKGEGERLVAFYTTPKGAEVKLGGLREFLQMRLPSYMVPDVFVALEAMPTLPNGKLDRRALRTAIGTTLSSDVYAAPETAEEKTLALIWSEVLELPEERIGRHAHFFEIGGHSLAATRVVARIKDQLQMEVGLSEVFELPVLSALAERVAKARAGAGLAPVETSHWSLQIDPSSPPEERASRLLEDRVVLFTGMDRAINRATARLLANHGAAVAINSFQDAAVAERLKDLIERAGGQAALFEKDVTDEAQAKALVEAVRAELGGIDALVIDADIARAPFPFLECEWGDLEDKVTLALRAVSSPCRAIAPEMIRRGAGSIIAVSEERPERADGGTADMTAQVAVDSFLRSLAAEVGPRGVRVNTVLQRLAAAAPGATPSRIHSSPRDLAEAILFLASDVSRFMTGCVIPLHAG